MAARGKRSEGGGQHQRDEQYNGRHGVAWHHHGWSVRPLDPQAEPQPNIQDIYQVSIWKAWMAVHRTAKSRQAAVQRVAWPDHMRNTPSARRAESLTEQAYRVIEEQIVTLRLKPGDVVSEQFLSVNT